jgi:hypothetical protein
LFTDPSKGIVKAVLCNGNKFLFVPVAYAANLKESYEHIKQLLEKIQYKKYNWNICEDLKVTCLACSLVTQSCVAFGVSGTAGTVKTITSENSSLNKNCLFQDRKFG